MLVQLCRSLLWLKFGTEELPVYFNDLEQLKTLAEKCSLNKLNAIMQLFWTQEELFLRTNQKQILLETVLLQICQQVNIAELQDLINLCTNEASHAVNCVVSSEIRHSTAQPSSYATAPTPENKVVQNQTANSSEVDKNWQNFLEKISKLDDPLLISILQQTKFVGKDEEKKLINIAIANNSTFFKNKITESKDIWLSLLKETFGEYTGFNFINQNIKEEKKLVENKRPAATPPPKSTFSRPQPSPRPTFAKRTTPNVRIDISDKNKWPKANLIAKYFPGKLKKINNYN